MKQKLFSIPGILLLAIVLFIASCTKDGPAGATGPAGPAGPAGAAGTAGATGATGPAGTANVMYSDWIDTVTYHGTDSTGWFAQINAPQLVDSILNTGDVKVYVNVGSDSANSALVMALPIYDLFLTGDVINPYFSTQLITLAATVDESSFTLRTYHYFRYRYVLIPGGIKVGRGVNTINWDDYKQVKAYLKLKD